MNPALRAVIAVARQLHEESHAPAPRVGFILGSGLGGLADRIESKTVVSTKKLPGFPQSTTPGHEGSLIFGMLNGVSVAALKGRIHVYEGHSLATASLTARALCGLGIRTLVVTNAAGALHADWRPGEVMLIRDHLNLLGGSPLEGANDDGLGARFVDMSACYPPALRAIAKQHARACAITMHEGVYAAVRGPQYETPAEIRMLGLLGADTVGMSTVPEVIVAAHMGVQVLGLSVVTNVAAGLTTAKIHHEEVIDTGNKVASGLSDLMHRIVPEL